MDLRTAIDDRLSRLADVSAAPILRGARKGLEKESLRVTSEGTVATTPHPALLGSALTHPFITTDYSEALIELITPPFEDVADSLDFLADIHAFVWAGLGEEMLWAASMPCRVDGDESIPIADYGDSNTGRMKRVYRVGLGHRYGRMMQAIAGVHFNYSFPDSFWAATAQLDADSRAHPEVVADGYFALLRNFLRFGWIVPLLFGSSPAICRSYVGADPSAFSALGGGTWYQPHATSLRMSDIGYKNENQASLEVSYDDLDGYVRSLTRAIETPYPPYEAIGVKVDGEYRQLNSNILQIENEYYSFVRPKQIAKSGEKPTLALSRRGVRYVEVRALDLDPYSAIGVRDGQLRFIEAVLVLCALAESGPIGAAEHAEIEHNQIVVAREGRAPGLELRRDRSKVPLHEWCSELLDALGPICELLDEEHGSGVYRDALAEQRVAAGDPGRLPSARMLEEMRGRDESFFELAMRLTRDNRAAMAQRELAPEVRQRLEAEVARSIAQQRSIEASDRIGFDEFLARYFNQAGPERQRLLG